jgi:glycosyltransferase involved in cell wall biosynthesis
VVFVETIGYGGVAQYTAELGEALARLGHTVDVVTSAEHQYGEVAGVRVHPAVVWERGRSRAGGLLRRLRLGPVVNAFRFVRIVPRTVRMARRSGVLHIQGPYFLPLFALLAVLARLAGVRVVYTPHNLFMRTGPQFPRTRALIFRCSAGIVLHVRTELDQLPAWAARKARVIPLGTFRRFARADDAALRADARRRFGFEDGHLVALLFGQMRRDKGIRDLLAAAEQVPEVAVLIAGHEAGGLAASRDLLASPALQGRLTVREGYQSSDEVAAAFAAADVSVHPYSRASQSGAALLAYGFDTPIVVYPVGGLPDLVEDGETGWVTARTDVAALAETFRAIIALGTAECERRGWAGGQLADERYSWPAIARQTAELYEFRSSCRLPC